SYISHYLWKARRYTPENKKGELYEVIYDKAGNYQIEYEGKKATEQQKEFLESVWHNLLPLTKQKYNETYPNTEQNFPISDSYRSHKPVHHLKRDKQN